MSQLETNFAIFVAVMTIISVACIGIPVVHMLKDFLSDLKKRKKNKEQDRKSIQKRHEA